MNALTRIIGSGFGALVAVAGVTAFAFATAPAGSPPALAALPATTSTTAAPEIITPVTVTKKVLAPPRTKTEPVSPKSSTTLPTIPQYLVDRIPGPETAAENSATDYVSSTTVPEDDSIGKMPETAN